MSNSNLKSAIPHIERLAKEVYEGWKHQEGWVPWIERGNSEMQDKACRVARDDLRSRGFILLLDGQWVLTSTGELHLEADPEVLAETDYSVYAKGFTGGEAYSLEPQQIQTMEGMNEVFVRVNKEGRIEVLDAFLIAVRAQQGHPQAIILQALLERTGEEVDYLRFLAAHFTGSTSYGMNFVLKAINVAYEATGKKVPDQYKVQS